MTMLEVVLFIDLVLLVIAVVVVPIGAYCRCRALVEARESVKILEKLNKELKSFASH